MGGMGRRRKSRRGRLPVIEYQSSCHRIHLDTERGKARVSANTKVSTAASASAGMVKIPAANNRALQYPTSAVRPRLTSSANTRHWHQMAVPGTTRADLRKVYHHHHRNSNHITVTITANQAVASPFFPPSQSSEFPRLGKNFQQNSTTPPN